MNDLISRRAAIEHLRNRLYETELNNDAKYPYYAEMADNRVSVWLGEVPTIDPVKHGEWKLLPSELVSDDGLWGETLYACSNCGYERHVKYRFCPNCGAKMDGKEQKSYADWVVKRE